MTDNNELIKNCLNIRNNFNPIIWSTIILVNHILLGTFSIILTQKQQDYPKILYFYISSISITLFISILIIKCLLRVRNTNEEQLLILSRELLKSPDINITNQTIETGRKLMTMFKYIKNREYLSFIFTFIHFCILFISFILFN